MSKTEDFFSPRPSDSLGVKEYRRMTLLMERLALRAEQLKIVANSLACETEISQKLFEIAHGLDDDNYKMFKMIVQPADREIVKMSNRNSRSAKLPRGEIKTREESYAAADRYAAATWGTEHPITRWKEAYAKQLGFKSWRSAKKGHLDERRITEADLAAYIAKWRP